MPDYISNHSLMFGVTQIDEKVLLPKTIYLLILSSPNRKWNTMPYNLQRIPEGVTVKASTTANYTLMYFVVSSQ